ncbi:S-layer homology domain-containing protein [Oscillatoria salina]|uniref:S-layer homology domain-containing protein n=1 Tax=Oscillatoria salina TaxID=331517 RepID=UPI001CCD90B7|nr:S-layer homology domain-containing protein [Oscillatoria salina]MBZ8182449.1 S-layer homology domain-containing protein [Oscillatoria salina IIICB1]
MNNYPPPDPRRSSISFDEWIAIFIALGTIGTILVVSLVPKGRAWNFLSGLATGETTSQPIFTVRENPLAIFSPTEKAGEREIGDRASSQRTTTDESAVKSPQQQQTVIKSAETQTTPILVKPATSTEAEELSKDTLTPETTTLETDPPIAPGTVTPAVETVDPEQTTVEEPQLTTPSPELSSEPEAETVTEPRFEDVSPDYWAYPYIEELADRGIISGVSAESFQPNRPITRQEFAFILENAFENQPILKESNFEDVDAEVLSRLQQQGISQTNGFLSGYPGNRFLPNEDISKLHVLVALASGLNLTPTGDPNNVLQVYQDATQIPDYAREKLAATTEAGIVVNYPNPQQLEPNRPATRAEVAALIYKSLVSQGKARQINSQD